MILADVLSGLVETDTDLLLAINGWRAEWADYFMYAFSGKWIWVPLYAALLYVIVATCIGKLPSAVPWLLR